MDIGGIATGIKDIIDIFKKRSDKRRADLSIDERTFDNGYETTFLRSSVWKKRRIS